MMLQSSENNKQTLTEQIKRDDVILPHTPPQKKFNLCTNTSIYSLVLTM